MPSEVNGRLSEEKKVKVLSGWRRWLPFYLYRKRSGWKLEIFWFRTLVWTVLLTLGGYLALGTMLFANDRLRHGLDGISWIDRVFPPNWSKYRVARGESHIRQANESLAANDFATAFHQLRVGLARAPKNEAGRLLLAEMYRAMKRPDLAEQVLIEGTAFHYRNQAYIKRLVRALLSRERDATVIQLANDCLDLADLPDSVKRFLVVSAAHAKFHRGNFDQAESTLETHQLSNSPSGRLLAAKIEWARGFPELAIAMIEQLSREFPDDRSIYRTHIQWLVQEGHEDTARRLSLLRRVQHPDQSQPRIDLLYAFDKIGDEVALQREANALFEDFVASDTVILQIGDFAANTGRPDLARRVLEFARSHDINEEVPSLMLVEAQIVAGNYRQAVDAARAILELNPDWEEWMAPVFHGLQAIAFVALGDREEANLFLGSYLGLEEVRAENLVAVANRLLDVGAEREARKVLTHAVRADPQNQAALTRLIELDLESKDAPNLPQNLAHLLEMRRASPRLLRQAYDVLGSDRYVFALERNQILDRLLESLSGKSSLPSPSGA